MLVPMTRARRCGGISIIELMLVMMALMFLAGVGWKAATATIINVNNSRISAEMGMLGQGLDEFALRFGEYPPDFHDPIAVTKFLKRRFPKCPCQKYPDFFSYSPAAALYFWLGGPNGRGFSADPANPFGNGGARIGPFFKFTADQLKRVDGVMQYYPPRGIDGSPYIYFRGGVKGYDGHPGWLCAKPYRKSSDGSWINRDSYQILCPGADGQFGSGNHYPDGSDYDDANLDDIANFTQGDTMQQAKPKSP
jgi:hypothetical protein